MSEVEERDGLVPELRFREFSGAWEIKGIGSEIDLISGIALKSAELTEDDAGIPILRGINITEGRIRHSSKIDKYYTGDTSAIDKFLVKEKDIVIGMDGSKVGRNVALITENDAGSILIQRVARIRTNNLKTKYLYQHFLSQAFKNYVDIVNTSSGIPHISIKQIKDFEIGFPPKRAEQKKISKTLSSLDALITAHIDKLTALREHKKGLLQQLFPGEGEVVPGLRFGGFVGEWEEKLVGKIFEITRGRVLSMSLVSDTVDDPNIYPVYSSQTKRNGLAGYYDKFLYEDAITWTTDGANAGEVNFRSGKFYCTNVCGVLLSDTGFANTCMSEIINAVARKHVSYVGNPKLMNGVMAKIRIRVPSVSEQQEISRFIDNLDDFITAQSKRIRTLRNHKKGLMQRIFPNPEGK